MNEQKKREKFTEDVSQHVIERNLLKNLAEDLLSPEIVADYTDEMLDELTAESQVITVKRAGLEEEKESCAGKGEASV